jgi:hypothetical protein
MPKIRGIKAHAISGTIRDLPESNHNSQTAKFLALTAVSTQSSAAMSNGSSIDQSMTGSLANQTPTSGKAAPSSSDLTTFENMPDIGITKNDEIEPEEVEPHFFLPNFIRPLPEADDDPELDEDILGAEYDVS